MCVFEAGARGPLARPIVRESDRPRAARPRGGERPRCLKCNPFTHHVFKKYTVVYRTRELSGFPRARVEVEMGKISLFINLLIPTRLAIYALTINYCYRTQAFTQTHKIH